MESVQKEAEHPSSSNRTAALISGPIRRVVTCSTKESPSSKAPRIVTITRPSQLSTLAQKRTRMDSILLSQSSLEINLSLSLMTTCSDILNSSIQILLPQPTQCNRYRTEVQDSVEQTQNRKAMPIKATAHTSTAEKKAKLAVVSPTISCYQTENCPSSSKKKFSS